MDIGQTLTKVAYISGEELILEMYPTRTDFNKITEILEEKKDKISHVNFTGGKAFEKYKKFSKLYKSKLINEFEANIKGIELMYYIDKNRSLDSPFMLVNFGTGTSIVLKKENIEHLGGSAMGGGLFMGLIKLLFNLNDYEEALRLASKGNRYNVDLKVSDIYSPEDDRVDRLFREYTAASLGKITRNIDLDTIVKEDVVNSVISMIGENIGSMVLLNAEKNGINYIVFSGGFLKENNTLKQILSILCRISKKKAIFIKNSEFCGAVGAILH